MVTKKAPGIVEPGITEPDVQAFIALAAGVASQAQQIRALDWLLTEACRMMTDPVEEVKLAGSSDVLTDLAFASGRRHVGVLVRRMLLPDTLVRAKAMTKALHPEATSTSVPAKPSLSQRRSKLRGKQ